MQRQNFEILRLLLLLLFVFLFLSFFFFNNITNSNCIICNTAKTVKPWMLRYSCSFNCRLETVRLHNPSWGRGKPLISVFFLATTTTINDVMPVKTHNLPTTSNLLKLTKGSLVNQTLKNCIKHISRKQLRFPYTVYYSFNVNNVF